MKKHFTTCKASGFSLAEVLAALTIGAMVLVAVLGIYSRAERSAAAIMRKLDRFQLPSEVLQRIAEDLDRIISSDSDTKITIENKLENNFPTARLTITRTITDSRNAEQQFEQIVWQSSYDYASLVGGLVLYRSHGGITLEDKLLDEKKGDLERELFVPICSGVTFFRIRVPRGETYMDQWPSGPPPPGVEVTISFAEPYKAVDGTLDVPDEEKIARTIAIDRTRKIEFAVRTREYDQEDDEPAPASLADERTSPRAGPKRTEKDER